MLWALFQAAIIFVVVASNIHWEWTPNAYLASILGCLAAYLATLLVSWLWLRIQARRRLRSDERTGKRNPAFFRGEPGSVRRAR